ncbi:MAG TPA: VanW family protein [Acidimicrobiales bacterium]|nr:VanW family protein [Acidimicrobiales bacterium]
MSKVVRRVLVALVALAGVALVVVVAWGVDLRGHRGEVLRNTRLGGRDVGGLSRAELAPIVADVAADFRSAEIRVVAPGGGFTTDAAQLGVSVSAEATVEAALDEGRTGNPFGRLAGWVRSIVSPRDVAARVSVDPGAVHRTTRERDPGPRVEPVEPHIVLRDGTLEVGEGRDGRGIDAADVIDRLPEAAARGRPVVVDVERGPVEPRWSEADVERLIDRARALVDEPVPVKAGDAATTLRAAMVRSWIRSQPTDSALVLVLDRPAALDDLGRELASAGTPAVETTFSVAGGAVRLEPGRSGTKCCAEEAVRLIEERVLSDDPPATAAPVELPLTEREPALSEAEARELRIVEPVGSATTNHPAGQPRVQNIHRIADLVRGQVIPPGKSFSVNEFVGRRTRDKGFVPAPVIEEGRFSEDVGGGVSQFATTLFNAAFFAGLDFGEYQSHSIYISRYPYGREATLSYPHPDLVVENTTPYGVLIWPTYTSTSITVTLYSTRYVEGSQTGQTETRSGNCTRVVTERTRRYVDGRVERDTVAARYRPAEGVAC